MTAARNLDDATVRSFGEEWSRFDQSTAAVDESELLRMFREYFDIFPWERLAPHPRGVDIGCGTGRWARLVAQRVSELHCVDASAEALAVARRNLAGIPNVVLHHAPVDDLPFEDGSLDFAYSLGVLHHLPDTRAALRSSVRILKPGAPFLLYLYYAFDNRPLWYRALWRTTDGTRRAVSRLPPSAKALVCDGIALVLYWPLARAARLLERLRVDASSLPLSIYRNRSFYSMRTDSRDRFGTPLEKRFRASEIEELMRSAGLADVRFSAAPPYWCAVGIKA
jgi:SAM-dependent methyltransferase